MCDDFLDDLEDDIMAEFEAEECKPDKAGWLKKRQTGPAVSLEDWQVMWIAIKGPRIYWQESELHAAAGELVLTSDAVILTARKSLEIVAGNTTLLLLAATAEELLAWRESIEAAAVDSAATICDAKLVGR